MTVRRVRRSENPTSETSPGFPALFHATTYDAHHLVDVEFYEISVDREATTDRFVFRMTVDDAWSLSTKLLSSIEQASRSRLVDVRRGECETCGNLRMVEDPNPLVGTTYCPDCGRRSGMTWGGDPNLPPIPTLDVWETDEVATGERPAG